ncbi:hypothetical protein HNQ35_000066 [Cerasibacillus quisquiliarum]|uniref:Bacteriophage Gp15 protein n=1 Tax=Cerasibacillus quisquiliarum TaxID=227865 RepID=A0A511UWG2_9BACI|nr:Gp15 family bacteriophage protein [Cerasibacillus quisquiliarum]MBB5144877.1 hypothetical protein [Cerasibacillus quisquiliarum]GEN30231.1 hypothetical protein CQU01_04690 [Cerasibacillus quisquiliarum]
MNLAYPIEDIAEIDGVTYELDMSYDNILRLFDLLKDNSLSDASKVNTGLIMLINDDLEQYEIEVKAKIFVELFKNAVGNDESERNNVDLEGNPMPDIPNDDKRAYDLVQDAEYIYASFMSDYGIDLFEVQGKLHWYKFKALLNGLTDKSKFMRVVEIRQAELPKGKGMQKERERIRKLKEHYALKEDDSNAT